MDKFEQPFVIKFLSIKGLRSKATHTELERTLGATMHSLTQVKELVGDSRQATFLVRTILAQNDRSPTWRSLSAIS
jgi:hypothetical protein